MNKEQFLTSLEKGLKKLPHEEREDIMHDFEEHFFNGSADGKTEEQISESLGSPKQIAKELVATSHIEKMEATASTANIFRAVWAVVGLGFFNFIIVFGPFAALLGFILAGWITGVSFVASPLLILVTLIVNLGTFEFFDMFFSIMLCGIGLFIAMGMLYVTKVLTTLFVRYLKYNVSLVKGGLKHD
ncbi:HAAS signaling domain-containing protein [Lentibacillus amyloliquefaciens]|uniref:DUF1700 domain-containing protein n=1 Tax=Lentibacillus amyloliquefaciens TaxID=1472767 RepID=A0A0U4FIG7_9BACI|nr:DUF1700 domain-containing protein [Lentibacillus amyloliquefaciens]ALX48414.1 hypothetical protein AOX59_07190 [Lentibacillus amyloliquefaciens]